MLQPLPQRAPLLDVAPTSDAHRHFVETLQGLGAVLWEMDAQTWRFTFVSPRAERLFGYPLARWYDEPTFWQDVLLHPDDREWCVRYCTIASGECRNHAFLYRARRPDGGVLWIKDVVRVIADAEGRPGVMRGLMLDVTDEKREAPHLHGEALEYDSPELEELRRVLIA